MSRLTAMAYLISRGALSSEGRNTLRYIRNSEHAVTLQMISDDCIHGITKAKAAIRKLIDLALFKQDSRSIWAGYQITNPASMFYTCSEEKELINLIIRYDIV